MAQLFDIRHYMVPKRTPPCISPAIYDLRYREHILKREIQASLMTMMDEIADEKDDNARLALMEHFHALLHCKDFTRQDDCVAMHNLTLWQRIKHVLRVRR